MSFEEVFVHIVEFMELNPSGNYQLMVGTDSQVHKKHTVFHYRHRNTAGRKWCMGLYKKSDDP